MSDQKVVVLYSGSLLVASIESYLRSVGGLQIVHLDATEQAQALTQLDQIAPAAVILDEHDGGFAVWTVISAILNQPHATRILSLDLKRNLINIYRREGQLPLTKLSLATALTAEPMA
jgi:CheY-like chemotaxis protein